MRLFFRLIPTRALGLLSLIVLPALLHIPANAAGKDVRHIVVLTDGTVAKADSIAIEAGEIDEIEITSERESIFPEGSRSLATSHFTWGADMGASIDVTANDQSTFDADVVFGYKNNFIRLAGIGAGIHRAFGTGDNFIPLYAVFRSSFSPRPRLCFLNFKAGYSFNSRGNAATYGDVSASLGIGFNLAISRRFMSHIILSYGFRHYSDRHRDKFGLDTSDVSLAELSIGVNF